MTKNNRQGPAELKGRQGRQREASADLKAAKPVRVLSTSLGVMLAAQLMLPAIGSANSNVSGSGAQPTLVEWSNEDVKRYFDPALDWNLPLPPELGGEAAGGTEAGNGSSGNGSGINQAVTGGGFGWDDLLLYHMIFNRGGMYSTGTYHRDYPTYTPNNRQPYTPRTVQPGSFRNQPVTGSSTAPRTSNSTGSFTTKSSKSTSSSPGSIGRTSSGFGSSAKASGSSFGG